jgi:hypothetical protein
VLWDIKLTSTNAYKSDLRELVPDVTSTRRVLLSQQPRFIWRARLKYSGRVFFDMLGDASDFGSEDSITHSFPIFDIVWFDEAYQGIVEEWARDSEFRPGICEILGRKLADMLGGSRTCRVRS